MKTLLIAGLLLFQDAVDVKVGTPTDDRWPISGKVDLPEGTELAVTASRIERRWEPRSKKFIAESFPEKGSRRTPEVSRKSFKTALPAGPAGMYEVRIRVEDERLFNATLPMGRLDKLFRAEKEHLPKILACQEKALQLLHEIERIVAGQAEASPTRHAAFIKEAAAEEEKLAQADLVTDFTATIKALKSLLLEIRNSQMWGNSAKGPAADNDAVAGKRGCFTDPNVTAGALEKALMEIPAMLSVELRVSIASILAGVSDDQIAALAKEAKELVDDAPVAEPKFEKLVEGDHRGELQEYVNARVTCIR